MIDFLAQECPQMTYLVKWVHLSASRCDPYHKQRFFVIKTMTPMLPPHDPPDPTQIKVLPPPIKVLFFIILRTPQSPNLPK